MIASDHIALFPGKVIASWNEQTWFQDFSTVIEVKTGVPPWMLRLHYRKQDEENKIWDEPSARSVDVTPDQELALDDGRFVEARRLWVGARLQNQCGNGHWNLVEKIEKIATRECVDCKLDNHSLVIARGGVILRVGKA